MLSHRSLRQKPKLKGKNPGQKQENQRQNPLTLPMLITGPPETPQRYDQFHPQLIPQGKEEHLVQGNAGAQR